MTIHRPDSTPFRNAVSATVLIPHRRALLGVTGADRLDLIHRLSTNNLHAVPPGQERTTVLTTEKGRIVDLLRVVVLEERLLLASARDDARRALDWIEKYTIMDDVVCVDATDQWRVLGIYGESARVIVEDVLMVTAPDRGEIRYSVGDRAQSIVLRDDRLNGGSGFLILIDAAAYAKTHRRFVDKGAVQVDDACYEALRIAAGWPAAETEITDAYNPLEAGIVQYVSWTKGCYIGQEVIARLDTYDKVQRHLMGIRFKTTLASDDDGALAEVYAEHDKTLIGTLTSAAVLPDSGETIGLAYIKTAYTIPGLAVTVQGVVGAVQQLPLEL